MTFHRMPYKTALFTTALFTFAFGCVVAFGVPQVFGGGGGGMGGNCGNCGTEVGSTDAGSSYEDSNGNGRPDPGERANSVESRGGGGGGGGQSVAAPPPPRPCTLSLDAAVIASGTPSVVLSWSPAPRGNVVLRRSQLGGGSATLPVSANATTYTDSVSQLRTGTYTYRVAYSQGVRYACTATLAVVDKITECNDKNDNGDPEDTLEDQQDPGCHTDGNPGNASTYDSLAASEGNPPADLVPTVTTVTRASVQRPIVVTASVANTSEYYAVSNSLVYGWRDTRANAPRPRCGINNRRCFVENGHTFLRLNTFTRTYNAKQQRTDTARSFRPPVAGQYQVCAIADHTNTVFEGVSGEANNRTCRTIIVDDAAVSAIPVFTDMSISLSPSIVRSGQTSELSWDTGGRVECTLAGSNGHTIDVSDPSRWKGTETTSAIIAQSSYKLACTDIGGEGEETATIRLIPQYQEI